MRRASFITAIALSSSFFACKADDNHVDTGPESSGGLALGAGGGTGGVMVGSGGLAVDTGGGVALDSGGLALGTGGGMGGVTVGSGGATGGVQGGSTGSCATDLTGTWDLVATSSYGSTRPGVLVISGDTFSLSVTTESWGASTPSTKQLAYSSAGAKTLTWSRTDDPVIPIDVQYTPANLEMGGIPLAVGGQWVFSVNRTKCLAAIDTTSTILCQSNPAGKRVGGTWPFPIPLPRLNTTYTLTRTSQLASQFGFLGGQWQTSSSSSSEACTMKVEGATVTILCKTTDHLNGSAQITVGANCVASGTTNTGWELSARRR